MSSVRLIKKACLGVATGIVLGMVASVPVASAEALAPWWGLTSGARPTSLHSGLAKSEVQQLTVSATGGEYLVGRSLPERVVPWNATHQELQAILEELYGAGNVEVPEGQGDETGSKPYKIVFKGELADQPVGPLFTAQFPGVLGKLTGGRKETSVIETSRGAFDGQIVVTAENRGDTGTSGTVTIMDRLPSGLQPVAISGIAGGTGPFNYGPVNCVLATLTCTVSKELPPFEEIEVRVSVAVKPGAKTGEQNSASVSGGGAAGTITVSRPIQVGTEKGFGIEDYQLIPENAGGSIDTQAGSHPFQLTNVFTLNSQTPDQKGYPRSAGLAKDLSGELPPGLVGNPTPFAQCTDKQFSVYLNSENHIVNACPAQSAMGVATVTFNEPNINGFETIAVPIFNMVPRPGEPARFAFKVAGIVSIFLDVSVRTGKDYGVTVTAANIPEIQWLLSTKLTFWGVPGDPRHDHQRGWECMYGYGTCTPSTATAPPPLLIMPTSCEAPFESTGQGDSWGSSAKVTEEAEPLRYRLPEMIDGCNHLPFSPSISVAPDVPNGSTPTGLTVGVRVPQEAELNPEGLGESTLKDTTVALPVGVGVNPGGADGLEVCSEAQVGYLPGESSAGDLHFTSGLPTPFCPDGSKIATAEIETPLLPHTLTGAVYLGAQAANPFGSLVAMYLVVQDPVSGTLIKLAGDVSLDAVTGQLVSTFKNTPELPFETLRLHFFGGDRAPLGTPGLCGAYTTSAAFVPWSGNETVHSTSTFNITSGPNGAPCASPLPFKPELTAGTTSIQAGGFSPFTMTMSRADGNQSLKAITLKMPPGLLGTLANTKLCPEPQANLGTCGPESQIGETIVSVGLGGNPYTVKGGKVFITEGYGGAPYGLSIVNPAKAGPYDLGIVVVRAKIEVDQITAALTVTTDTTGPYKIPTILDGIPLQIQHVNVTINRPNFTFNPTNCSSLAVTGNLTSDQGATSAISVPFQVTNCAVLAFKPKLTVHTAGKTSRANGASLSVKLTYPAGPYDANIAKVKVDLPKQLPSKLPTLQKACPAATFETNPAACPPASIVGHATATTPVLPVGLSGPAYFVSHGGEAFPDLIIVLQGYGTTVHLVGSTFINEKTGVTSSTFKTIPDVPVGTFELNLPQGKYSALAATTNLCTTKLVMPTSFIAQNGASIHTNTPITPTGCTKHKAKKKAKKAAHHTKKGK
jgi:hypothetical protein